MTSTRNNSSDIFKAAHKLDKYLMKDPTSKQHSRRSTPPTKKRDSDEIDEPLSLPSVTDSSSLEDDDVVITNAKRPIRTSDTLSKFTKFKRKPQPFSNSQAKKAKVTTDDDTEEIDNENEKEVKTEKDVTKSNTNKQPKKVSALAMLKDDDSDDDVLNFTALAGICNPTKNTDKGKGKSEKSPATTPTTTTKTQSKSTSSAKKPNPLSNKNKIVPIVDVDDEDFIESDSEGKNTPKKKGKPSSKTADIISLIKGTATSSINTTDVKSSSDELKKPRTPLANKFTKPKKPTEMCMNPSAGLWADKYEPSNEQELAVQPKKIAEVRQWFLNSLDALQANVKYGPRMLILTGPCGGGKTALLRVLAKELSCEVCEWITPPLPVKKDSKDSLMLPYMPRLQEFQKWLRFAGLSQGLFATTRKILLIEDLPFLSDVSKSDEFRQTIREFLASTHYPLVFILSDTYMGNSAVNTILSHDILGSPCVTQMSVNAITETKAKKGIERIVRGEQLDVTREQIESIVHDNEGDIRAIVNSLQFFCIGRAKPKEEKAKGKGKNKTKDKEPKKKEKGDVQTFLGSRDISLSLFHALGKILYNKRLPETDPNVDVDSPYYRPPMENIPEQVVERVHVEPSMFNMFLHQNYTDFFTDIDDISTALEYLTDADRLAKPWEDTATFGPFVASVAARGFQYAQAHEFEHKWLPLKKPQVIETMRTKEANVSAAYNMFKDEVYSYHTQLSREDMPPVCIAPSNLLLTEILPFMHKILSPSTPIFRDSAVMTKFYPAKSNSNTNINNSNNNNNNNNNGNTNNNNNSTNYNNNNNNTINKSFNTNNNFNNNTTNQYSKYTTSNTNNNFNTNKNNNINNFNNKNNNTSGNTNYNNNFFQNHFKNMNSQNNTPNNSNTNKNNTQIIINLPPTTPADYESFLSGPSYNLLTSLCTFSSSQGTVPTKLESWFIPEDENAPKEEEKLEAVTLSDDIEEF